MCGPRDGFEMAKRGGDVTGRESRGAQEHAGADLRGFEDIVWLNDIEDRAGIRFGRRRLVTVEMGEASDGSSHPDEQRMASAFAVLERLGEQVDRMLRFSKATCHDATDHECEPAAPVIGGRGELAVRTTR